MPTGLQLASQNAQKSLKSALRDPLERYLRKKVAFSAICDTTGRAPHAIRSCLCRFRRGSTSSQKLLRDAKMTPKGLHFGADWAPKSQKVPSRQVPQKNTQKRSAQNGNLSETGSKKGCLFEAGRQFSAPFAPRGPGLGSGPAAGPPFDVPGGTPPTQITQIS